LALGGTKTLVEHGGTCVTHRRLEVRDEAASAMEVPKDPSILDLVSKLRLPSRGWITVDDWDGDLCAIGIASSREPRRVVYVSTWNKKGGRYYYESESPTGPDPTDYEVLDQGEDVDFTTLLQAIDRHLSIRLCRKLSGLPPYGATAISYPSSFARSGREGSVVEFLPDTPAAWIGNFAPGLGGYSGVHVHPNGRQVVLFCDGAGRVVDPQTRDCSDLPGSNFIFDARRVTNPPGLVCDSRGTHFFRLGPEGLVWHTRRLSIDGFRDVVFTQDRIIGSGIEMDGKTWTAFEVDLRTGDAKSGPYVPIP
jgi:hypothetical protein